MSSDFPGHFCSGCSAPQKPFPRYPWHFCNDCLETATDRDGRRLLFYNADISGGMVWGYDKDNLTPAMTVLCLISGRPVVVTEARFGGIVAQPVPSSDCWDRPADLVDLTLRRTGQ